MKRKPLCLERFDNPLSKGTCILDALFSQVIGPSPLPTTPSSPAPTALSSALSSYSGFDFDFLLEIHPIPFFWIGLAVLSSFGSRPLVLLLHS